MFWINYAPNYENWAQYFRFQQNIVSLELVK